MTRIRRWAGGLLAAVVLGGMAGCASTDAVPSPPAGLLDNAGADWVYADTRAPATRQEIAARKAAEKKAEKAAAEAKNAAAAEKKQRLAAEKQAATEAKRAAAEQKAAEKLAKKEAAQAAAEVPQAAAEQNEAAPASAAAAEAEKPEGASAAYVLQAGDELDIQVYREPELSGSFTINPAGEIRHSLMGSMPMAGKSVEEAEAFFTRKLAKDYLVDPRVIVKLLSTRSAQIVLMGEVKNPGVYPLSFDEPTTLLQAIAGAGGFTDLASPDRVRIVRRMPDGHQTTLKFRVSDLLDGKGKQRDIPLEPGDVIMVPEVLF